jgi:hypothetical protein
MKWDAISRGGRAASGRHLGYLLIRDIMVKHGDLAAFDVKIVTLQVGVLSTWSPHLTVFTRGGNLHETLQWNRVAGFSAKWLII